MTLICLQLSFFKSFHLPVIFQVIAAYMMIETLNKKGYKAFSLTVPSLNELVQIFGLAAPVFVTMMSKVSYGFC